MALEIERKFLVKNDGYKIGAERKLYRQGYLNTSKNCTIRVRVIDQTAYLTIKGPSYGPTRQEYEYSIPYHDAVGLLELCQKPLIEKYRYKIAYEDRVWEVDEFLGENEGLAIAEIELESEDQPFAKPDWVGREVTLDPRYYNSNLIYHPYRTWKETD